MFAFLGTRSLWVCMVFFLWCLVCLSFLRRSNLFTQCTLFAFPKRVLRRGNWSNGLLALSSAKESKTLPHTQSAWGQSNCPKVFQIAFVAGLFLAQASKSKRSHNVGIDELLDIFTEQKACCIKCPQAPKAAGCFWIKSEKPLTMPVLSTDTCSYK